MRPKTPIVRAASTSDYRVALTSGMLRFPIRVVDEVSITIVACTSRHVPTRADQTLHVAQGRCLSGTGLTVLLQAVFDIDLRVACPTCYLVDAVLACHLG